jgi:hypothetical protein
MEAKEKQCFFIRECVIIGDKKACWVSRSFFEFQGMEASFGGGHELYWEWFFSHGKDKMGFPS